MKSVCTPCAERSAGFTLVELLLVIALIGVLASFLVPTLTRARSLASLTGLTSRLGSHAKVLIAYTQDHRDFMPAFTDPKATYSLVYVDETPIKLGYFDTYWSWHIALAERTFHTTHHDPAFYETRPEFSPVTSIWYSSSFAAEPAFWRDTTRTGPNQWRATKLSEVQFPSQKAVLFANEAWRQSRGKIAPLGFMDASAEGVPEASLKGGYPSGTGDWPGSGLAGPVPGMVTIDGVHGRDR